MGKVKKLTLKQQAFADFYIELGNATQAAIKAGYSQKTAYSIGDENLRKPEIKSYIEKRMEELIYERVAKKWSGYFPMFYWS
ncbi:terminase small subunit [Lysinibacillus sp. NPDC092081]|uniref:terminase small subunit n=1 Tax=Lysinibacillus sp. NPDC092081 TaxID=3364131 RepID=UPI00380B80C0